jgi:hypothetical protein
VLVIPAAAPPIGAKAAREGRGVRDDGPGDGWARLGIEALPSGLEAHGSDLMEINEASRRKRAPSTEMG